ncbi:MAG: glutamate 5-kinase, partial [Methylococcales bacterium]|nr:glutamate 5-kinase [Methylococcales bacterium]
MIERSEIQASRRWVVKIGSALLTDGGKGIDSAAIGRWVDEIVALRRSGVEVVLVSSGAVAEGMNRLGWSQRPAALYLQQAAAAVGQMGLVQTYESFFSQHGFHTAQILLTHDDLASRERYLNARSTLRALLKHDVIPIINENDTVATDEIRFGDNDTLGAMVANLVEADLLVILTDQEGMYDADPRKNPDAQLMTEVAFNDPKLDLAAESSGGVLGRGGMATKLNAVRLAACSGASSVIANGAHNGILLETFQGVSKGTFFRVSQATISARKQWLAGHVKVAGSLVVDAGAVRAVRDRGRSLLPVGISGVVGEFRRGDLVKCLDQTGVEVAQGLVNYNSAEIRQIQLLSSDE